LVALKHIAGILLLQENKIMIIKLFQPPTRCWLLIAEGLDDPPTWDRFLPSHSASSQRWKFDCAVKETSDGIKLAQCRDLMKRGTSVYEYDWETQEDVILCHAIQVAEFLDQDLVMEAPSGPKVA
jgi:hypothetical protein